MIQPTPDSFRIGPYLVSPSLNRVYLDDVEQRLEPKVMELLVFFAQRSGEVLSRQELLDQVWTGTVVTGDALNRSVSTLRGVLGDNPRDPRFIETIAKRGYRLIAEIDWRVRGDSVPTGFPVLELEPGGARKGAGPSSKPTARDNWPVYRSTLIAASLVVVVFVGWRFLVAPSPSFPLIPVQVTANPGGEHRPDLALNGSRVAFSRTPDGDENAKIFLTQIGESTQIQLTSGASWDSAPVWSSDGSEVLFVRFSEEFAKCEVWRVSSLGGTARRVSTCANTLYPDLTVGIGGSIAFNTRSSTQVPFSIHLATQGTPASITSPPGSSWGDHDPAFSPDGAFLAFTRSASEGMQDLYVIELASSSVRRLTDDARNILGSTWLPDSRTIVFSSNRRGRHRLWTIDRAGGSPELFQIADDDQRFPSVAANGSKMAYESGEYRTDIWEWNAGRATAVIQSSRWDLHPNYSPSGTQIAFASNRSGTYEIWISDAQGGEARRLTSFEGPFSSRPRWSPDGSSILFASRPDGNADLFVINVETSEISRLTETAGDELGAAWHPDGKRVLFSSNQAGDWEGWSIDINTHQRRTLGLGRSMGITASSDAATLYYARLDSVGLWSRDYPGGAETKVVADLDNRDWGSFAVRGATLYYLRRSGPSGPGVVQLDLDTGTSTELWVPEAGIPSHDPALDVSPDGARILVGQHSASETDIMVVDLAGNRPPR